MKFYLYIIAKMSRKIKVKNSVNSLKEKVHKSKMSNGNPSLILTLRPLSPPELQRYQDTIRPLDPSRAETFVKI